MIKDGTPRVEIDLMKIKHNAKVLKNLFSKKEIHITGVVKCTAGSLEVARAFIESGITSLADTKLINIEKMKNAGLKANFMLLRTPAMSEIEKVVQFADKGILCPRKNCITEEFGVIWCTREEAELMMLHISQK